MEAYICVNVRERACLSPGYWCVLAFPLPSNRGTGNWIPPPRVTPLSGRCPSVTQRNVYLHGCLSVSWAALWQRSAQLSGRSRVWRWLPAMIAPQLLTPYNGGRRRRREGERVTASAWQATARVTHLYLNPNATDKHTAQLCLSNIYDFVVTFNFK